ncbi:MAG: MFS transporter, partial [Elusimicrobia bacterium]|nr:MFS transporter [Elusimicrobiota bacterium]
FVFRREYKIFYWLNVMFGARKQTFLTFGPWILVTQYGTTPAQMAVITLIASSLAVIFRQAFGAAVDKFGERKIFIADAFIFLGICAGFIFSANVYMLYALFIMDTLMFATQIARTTYISKIALHKADVPSSISLGMTMDHAVSMVIPTLGGMLWIAFGYRSVFMAASLLAVAGFFVAGKIKDNLKIQHLKIPLPTQPQSLD